MNLKVSMLYGILVICEVCAQRNRKFQYSTQNGYNEDDESHFFAFQDSTENNRQIQKVTGVPLELLEQMNNISNVSEFFDKIIAKESMDSKELIASRFGDENVERSVGIIAKPANCIPEDTIVPLEPLNMSKDPTVLYFPSCTRVKRCGGCCSSPLLTCQPIETEIKTFLIYKSQFTGGTKMAYRGKEIVLVDEHKRCRCDCKIKKSDCNAYQIYDAPQCRCVCTNYDEQEKCLKDNEKIWDSTNCQCRCRNSGLCTTGTYFDERQCRCFKDLEVPYGINKSIVLIDRKRFIIPAIPVIPNDAAKYDIE